MAWPLRVNQSWYFSTFLKKACIETMPQKGIKIGVVSVKSERRLELTDIICHLTLSFGFTIKKISSINLTLLSVICTYSGAEESFQ